MLRASIRSALEIYKIKINLKRISEKVFSIFKSELVNIENALQLLDNPNHHKMMRKELTMNIFPFGDDGTDIFTVIKLVWLRISTIIYLICIKVIFWKTFNIFTYLVDQTVESPGCWNLPALHGHFGFERLRIQTATLC